VTPYDERPGVHVPGPFQSHPEGLDTGHSTALCATCKTSYSEALLISRSLCQRCHREFYAELVRKDEERKRLERERTVGFGEAYAVADGGPRDFFYLRCDRCPRVWVGRDGEVCDSCYKWRGDSAADPVTR
jgi:hypothetical protein